MRIRLLGIGTKMPSWVDEGVAEYQKRMPRECTLEVVELPLGNKGRERDPPTAMRKEAESLRGALRPQDHIVALEVRGKPWTTEQLGEQLGTWMQSGRDVALLVGGPDGLEPELSRGASQRWSLSPLTLPHPIVRIVLAEQIYRAHSLLRGHPYHRSG